MHSRVYGPAHPRDGSHPHRWARRIFLNGENDDVRDGMPNRTRPCVLILVCGSSGAHLYADMCLCSQFAGDAPSIDTAATAVIAAAVATVAVCPRRFPRRGIAALIWGRGGIFVTPVSTVGTGFAL